MIKYKVLLLNFKLSNVVKNEVVNKTAYDELLKKVNAIQTVDTSNLVKKADTSTKIADIEAKSSSLGVYITT